MNIQDEINTQHVKKGRIYQKSLWLHRTYLVPLITCDIYKALTIRGTPSSGSMVCPSVLADTLKRVPHVGLYFPA